MESENFFSTAAIEKAIVNRKVDTENIKVNWLKIREIEVLKKKPFSIFMRTDFETAAQEINIEKKRGMPSNYSNSNFSKLLESLWPNGKPIAEKKLEDLKSLLCFIPKDAKKFYKNLIGDPYIEEDINGFNAQPDFPLENDD
ncbi:unnamed protein product [Phaedon cochleariae]|uniref:Uncharacterized protein n=1 Tax=Phaedon cochleariae TaxID=80249 RepID=A0A9N9X327_PHACE|nr:unnamed protein product [Phaedon cochleariae]